MKALCLLLAVFISVRSADVSAQVVDMRAYSRQRGFKAYRAETPAQKRRVVPAQKRTEEAKEKDQNGESEKGGGKNAPDSAAQTAEMQEYIRNNPHVRPDI